MTLEQLRQLYAEKVTQAKALSSLAQDGKLTSEQIAQVDGLLNEADGLKAQIGTAERLAAAEKYANEPAGTKAAQNMPKQGSGGTPTGSNVEVTKDAGDQPWASGGEYFRAVKAVAQYGRVDPRLRQLEDKATGMSESVPADGGYLLPPAMASGILERMYSDGAILSRVAADPVTGNSMTYNGVDETSRVNGSQFGGVTAYWVGEGSAITASKPKFRQVSLKLKKVAALCYATDEQLEDTANLDSWLNRTVPQVLRFRVEDSIYEGDGVAKPLGIMNSPCLVSVLREDASKVQGLDIMRLWSRRWAPASDYVWLMNQDVTPQLLNLGSTYQNWYMPPGGLSVSPYATLLGRPILEVEYASTMGTTGDIMLASLSQYQAINKGGVKSASSIHVAFTTDEMAYRFTYRIDGSPAWHSALTPFKGSNTQSPFVTLTSASA